MFRSPRARPRINRKSIELPAVTIAALFVADRGPYIGRQGIDAWTKDRDARLYQGPYPVIAHPPCERWGRYWFGGPSAHQRFSKGDDGGCFAAALDAVRRFGGVLEHPAASSAWKRFELHEPPFTGGWIVADWFGGWTCHVEQGHYGHRARKATWLYAVSPHLPILKWGKSNGVKLDEGYHTEEERRAAKLKNPKPLERLSKRERFHTPLPFLEVLEEIASACKPAEKDVAT